jgi:hypothetical protein
MPSHIDKPDDLPWAQWRPEGNVKDNQSDIEALLANHHARCKRDGDNLMIQAWGGLSTHLEPGDCLVLDGDRLGVVRASLTEH